MVSTAEFKIGGTFLNHRKIFLIQQAIEQLFHSQPPIRNQTENYTASGIANKILFKYKQEQ